MHPNPADLVGVSKSQSHRVPTAEVILAWYGHSSAAFTLTTYVHSRPIADVHAASGTAALGLWSTGNAVARKHTK